MAETMMFFSTIPLILDSYAQPKPPGASPHHSHGSTTTPDPVAHINRGTHKSPPVANATGTRPTTSAPSHRKGPGAVGAEKKASSGKPTQNARRKGDTKEKQGWKSKVKEMKREAGKRLRLFRRNNIDAAVDVKKAD
ncbi:uncharacterized protein K460DRAFT_359759 [Cucurbitaria berberidis CBS 394.84]|uniref:Uncharacterized protein n=1 Tax=Cucurbitaria berberidis CBS 394.84 TaxID=1168544 RepID=A0A9P4G904_9PLEO|nr:uncharacterized protein K460DRAFT_359759 [Cucurbitaria berberidis CBS 394.84]KAF1841246.1 hypothetical protein K460DRAFT_359759 [Cucurbitaria berberidis CBS 394.84]